MKKIMMAVALALLLLCSCAQESEGKETVLSEEYGTDMTSYMGLTVSLFDDAAYAFTRETAEQTARLLNAAPRCTKEHAKPVPLFYLEYLDGAGEIQRRASLAFLQTEHGVCFMTGEQVFETPEALWELWEQAGIDTAYLRDAARTRYMMFEGCPESLAEYRLPAAEADTPQQALEQLFGAFLGRLRQRDIRRTFRVMSVESIDCRLHDSAEISLNPDGADWGYARRLREGEWLTSCSAGVTFIGRFNANGISLYGENRGGDVLRWGNLRLEDEEYIFTPCEQAVYESGLYERPAQ